MFTKYRRLFLTGMVMELCYMTFYLVPDEPREVLWFIAASAICYLLLGWIVYRPGNVSSVPVRTVAWVVVGFGVLFRLTVVPHTVVGSDDIYRYLWDGKVAASGINPYSYLPGDAHLSHLADADVPERVNHPQLRTVYPPLAQVLFLASRLLFGGSMAGLKLLLVGLDCLTMLFLWKFLRAHERSPLVLLLYAWSPVPVLYFGLDGHIDALGIPFLIMFLVYAESRRPVRSMIALGMSAMAKLYPLILLPIVALREKGFRRFLLPALPLSMLAIAYAIYFEPTWGVINSLQAFGSRWEFNGGVFYVLYLLTGSNETAHILSGITILVSLGIICLLDRSIVEKVFWAFVALLLLSPVVHPWYLAWLAALLVTRWSLPIFLFIGLSTISNVVVYQYRAFGIWQDQPLLLLIEYVPVLILLIVELARGRDVAPSPLG